MEPERQTNHSAFRNFYYYTGWFIFWGTLLAFFQPVYEAPEGSGFWVIKAWQAALGALFGLACGVAFTVLQNKVNISKKKWASWANAIAVWISLKVVVILLWGGA